MKTVGPASAALAALAVALAGTALAERPYLTPWVAIAPGDSIPTASIPGNPSPPVNRPGVLLEVPHDALGTPRAVAAAQDVVAGAQEAGWRAGLLVELHDEPEPVAGAAADAATAESLFPGLGAVLGAARGAGLFVLSFPELSDDPRPYRWVIRKVAAEIRAANPRCQIALLFAGGDIAPFFPAKAAELLNEEVAAYVDVLGLRFRGTCPSPSEVRSAADALVFGRPLLVRSGIAETAASILHHAAAFAAEGAPGYAAELAPGSDAAPLARLAPLLAGDFARDGRTASAAGVGGEPVAVFRAVSGTDLGGVVLLPGDDYRGAAVLTLDAPAYDTATIHDLSTGRSRALQIPRRGAAPRLSLSTAGGPLAVVLTAREKAPEDATRAAAGVSAVRPLTAEEILARHQAWRSARDSRWKRFTAVNTTAIRLRVANIEQIFDLTLKGPFFFELGKSYDWAWSEAYFNGVRWKGAKIPELPMLQPEKVSELPLALTFGDAYRYELKDDEKVGGLDCWSLDFEPRPGTPKEALYAGRVWISKSDFAVIRTRVRQLNLVGDVQSVDETTDFGLVPAPDGGAPLRLPTRTWGEWILKTFSRTTVMERDTTLTDVRLDPTGFETERQAAFASRDVMVRDTDQGMRYLEKTKDGGRVVAESRKGSQLFGIAGVYYDGSTDYPLPLAGVYYIDLDFQKRQQQLQVFFAGLLLAGSFNEPKLFGTNADLGVDLFGIAVRGTDTVTVDGTEDKAQNVKRRAFAGNLNVGYPLTRHLKLTATLGTVHSDYGTDSDTAPDFAVPTDHWDTRLEGRATYDVSGWALTGAYAFHKRSAWDAWGYPANPDWDPSRDEYRNWSVSLAKNFYLPNFRRIQASAAYLGTENADRFSKISFGSFGPAGLHGFRSGSLRGEKAVVLRAGYGIVVGEAFRLEGVYDHAFVKDEAAGLDWANFGGAGVMGQFNGPWSTLVRLDGGVVVVGRNRGQTGATINLTFLKFF